MHRLAPIPWHVPHLEESARRGIVVPKLIAELADHDCLTFPQLASGLFPATNTDVATDETGYANAWLRDSACVALGLLHSGSSVQVDQAARGMFRALHQVTPAFHAAKANPIRPLPAHDRPPVRYAGEDSDPLAKWANAQNDALGYALLFLGEYMQFKGDTLHSADEELFQSILEFLQVISFWADEDSGHWEEIPKHNASSIGVVLAGLRAIAPLLSDLHVLTALQEHGQAALSSILPNESDTVGKERDVDAALLFLVQPLHIVDGEMASNIVEAVESVLVRRNGVCRYLGDSYWGPDYREHFLMGDRAGDFSTNADMQLRDTFLCTDGEAQWTLFDPMLAQYYLEVSETTGDLGARERASWHLFRSLGQVIAIDDKRWRIPEAFFLEKGSWTPNDHLGLLWAQSNLLSCTRAFARVYGDAPINLAS